MTNICLGSYLTEIFLFYLVSYFPPSFLIVLRCKGNLWNFLQRRCLSKKECWKRKKNVFHQPLDVLFPFSFTVISFIFSGHFDDYETVIEKNKIPHYKPSQTSLFLLFTTYTAIEWNQLGNCFISSIININKNLS